KSFRRIGTETSALTRLTSSRSPPKSRGSVTTESPAIGHDAIASASVSGVRPRSRSPSFGERTLISESTGSTPSCCLRRMLSVSRTSRVHLRDRVRGPGELLELAQCGARVDVVLRHPHAFLRARRHAGDVEGEAVVEDEEVAAGPLVVPLEDASDHARVELRIASLDVLELRALEA